MESIRPSTCNCSSTFHSSIVTSQLGTTDYPASLDDILCVTQEVTELWPHLQACAICFPENGKSRTKDLLITYEKVVRVLEARADVFLSGRPRSRMTSAQKPANESLADEVHSRINFPEVFLGEFMLCRDQSLELLGWVYKDVLRNLAIVLYEMRRTSKLSGWEDLDELVARMLHRVLDLLDHAK